MGMTAVKDAIILALEEREERWVDEVLEAARERLRFGWTQGAFGRTLAGKGQRKPDPDTVTFCLIGALTSAARAVGADVYTLRRAERLIGEALDNDVRVRLDHAHSYLPHWNDEPERTKEEVITLVDGTLQRRQDSLDRR
jgi:hypothetical protein